MSLHFETSSYLTNLIASGRSIAAPISSQEASRLIEYANHDSRKLLYSSILSISDAISGIQKKRYSWATVQLYYSAFYSVRSILSDNNVINLYVSNRPYWLKLAPGETLKSPDRSVGGSTHKWAFFEFNRQFPNSPLCAQTIDNQNPFDWMMQKREEANYKRARFIEPSCPEEFSRLSSGDLRKFVDAYCEDDTYAFDKDHAILSFPLYVFSYAVKNMSESTSISNAEIPINLIDSYFSDRKGPISSLLKLKNKII